MRSHYKYVGHGNAVFGTFVSFSTVIVERNLCLFYSISLLLVRITYENIADVLININKFKLI